MDNEKLAVKLQETTDRSLRNEGRIKKLESENVVLHQLATSVAVMAEQMKGVNKNVATLTGEVEHLKDMPGKRWEKIVETIITVAVGALVGFIIAQIGLG